MPPKLKVDNWRKETHDCEWRGIASSSHTASGTHNVYPHSAYGTQHLQDSTGHPFQKLGETRQDIGGGFSVVRRELEEYPKVSLYHNRTVEGDGNSFAYNYRGGYYARDANVSDSSFPLPVHPTAFELDGMGATAIARVLPTNPIGGFSTFVGELREGLPSLVGHRTWRERALRARNAGDEYLNYQFGWLPLVSDIRAFAFSAMHSNEIIADYERGSGKLHRRRYMFEPSITTSTATVGTYPNPGLKVGYWNSQGVQTSVTTERVETWFSGAFTYYLPPWKSNGDNRKRDSMIANKLFGTRITPEVIWDLTPWTWAADWVANVGDVLHNASAFQNDGLVMPWGYIMRKRMTRVQVDHNGARMRRNNQELNLRQIFTTTVKSRRRATPYGFGLDTALFSARQWAILGALGLSRAPGKVG